ncbi:hypothetical protein [Ulvibacterium marinum]|uniref:Lipoprotein n=1 Tax=Ulvibacterium marinum TaxID=2419782 RepID=A0A3B0BXJ5_9FLAO|nr:hypothetical protein [Ulvibacterium marinum]RKN76819.1 hypothetical protein D7Z94_23850 [Ulvibacterium marinum]
MEIERESKRVGILIIVILTTISCIFLFTYKAFDFINPQNQYQITKTKIISEKGERIDSFSIAIHSRDSIKPNNYFELDRYCCSFTGTGKPSKQVVFNNINDGYSWEKCHVIFDYVEKDSLKNLTVKEKLEIIDQNNQSEDFDRMPFKFERDKVYHLFGLKGIEGSYYLSLDSSNNLIVEYFDGGPL